MDHVKHLEKLFLKCRKYGNSLNPRKSNFAMKEGKLLGHIISEDGIRIDLDRMNSILKVEELRNKKEVQSFIGHVIFLRRFIPSFVEILRNVTNMLKNDNEIKWVVDARKYFKDIKKYITKALVLVSPEFSKYFLVFSYASKHTIARVLLHKNNQNVEKPIVLFRKVLRDGELKYDIMEKKAYALVKSLKYFRVYILHSHIIAYVPSNMVKGILTHIDL